MTLLRHRVLDGSGQPVAGVAATARPWSGNKYALRSVQAGALTATSDAQGWLTWTVPTPARRQMWQIDRADADPIIVSIPSGAGTVTAAEAQVGTLGPQQDLTDTRSQYGFVPAQRPQFVSAYQSVPTDFATNQAAGISFRHTHRLTTGATDVRLVVPLGFKQTSTQAATDVLAPAAVPFKGSVELGGVARPVLFNGTRQRSCDPGGILVSDPIAADLADDTSVPVRVHAAVTTGQPYPNTVGTGQGPGATATGDGFSPGSDITDGVAAVGVAVTTGFVPHGLIGIPDTPQPAIGGVGDSILMGTGDSANNGGFLARATNGIVPLLRLAIGGNSAQGVAGGHSYSWPLLAYCTHAVVLLGANDLNTSNGPRTFAQFQADLATIYTALRKRGLRVHACTVLPRTNAGNTAVASTAFNPGAGSVRGQANAWIRAGADGLIDGYFETADAVETGRDTGFWKPGLTTDGAHPTLVGHTAMAAAISLGVLI